MECGSSLNLTHLHIYYYITWYYLILYQKQSIYTKYFLADLKLYLLGINQWILTVIIYNNIQILIMILSFSVQHKS